MIYKKSSQILIIIFTNKLASLNKYERKKYSIIIELPYSEKL